MNNNDIDKLFRQKLKDFGEVPDEKVWDSIRASLDQKKKSRGILPIWWRLGGVAALLAILFYVVDPIGTPDPEDIISPSVEQVENPESGPDDNIENDPLHAPEVENGVARAVNEVEKSETSAKQASDNPAKTSATTQVAATGKNTVLQGENDRNDPGIATTANQETEITAAAPETSMEITTTGEENTETISYEKDTGITVAEPGAEEKEGFRENAGDKVADNIQKDVAGDGVLAAEVENDEEDKNSKKKSIFDEVEEDEEVVAEKNEHRWSVGPSVAPVYFSSLGEGSPIHSNFATNSKSGNLNLSYGLSVSYDVSKKLSIRSGLHRVDYGYDTNDILFSSSLAASTNNRIDHIDYALTSKNLVVQSTANSEAVQDPYSAISNEIAAPTPSRDGRMVQQFGYLEVPVEVNYSLLDSKLGLHIIGGVSSLFLVDNTVTLESEGGSTQIGEANNINSLNFSTNIGFGVDYNISEKVRLNLEPMFKYQLNTFSDASGNFQPFSVGIYSGLSFKF
ncbi:MAG TPA: outer membrane beta-barrel protein [Eudoraea sp.]|nr:outer membrane beta-barrel protein [Eudoraea sp.]